MKISVITVVHNRESTIADSMQSIKSQLYQNIEHIVIDGASTDDTLAIVEKNKSSHMVLISEKDDGIYDAINKGILHSTGDVIGLLHSDDVYSSDSILGEIALEFTNPDLDMIYGDSIYVSTKNSNKIIRRFRSKRFSKAALSWGWMPAHTTVFFRRRVFEEYGLYKTDYKIAADIEFIARVFNRGSIRFKYLPKILVVMSMGGVSTASWKNTVLLNKEVVHALRSNGISTNLAKILLKYPFKILEFLWK